MYFASTALLRPPSLSLQNNLVYIFMHVMPSFHKKITRCQFTQTLYHAGTGFSSGGKSRAHGEYIARETCRNEKGIVVCCNFIRFLLVPSMPPSTIRSQGRAKQRSTWSINPLVHATPRGAPVVLYDILLAQQKKRVEEYPTNPMIMMTITMQTCWSTASFRQTPILRIEVLRPADS